jgi:uncharacterized membrane protein (UPF0127 family)
MDVRRARPFALTLVAALLLLTGCFAGVGCKQQPPPLPPHEYGKVDVKVGSRTFRLDIAATNATRRYGLMNRSSMPENRGMIFVFRDEQPLSFWMENTLIPLDIIYLSAAGNVVSIAHGKPMDKTNLPSAGPARFAIELNEGAAAAAGLKPGSHIDLPQEATQPADLE